MLIPGIDYVLVGEKISQKRKQNGLTQAKLAEQCNISISYIAHIEKGTRSPSLETIANIAEVLNVSLDYLLLDEITNQDRVLDALETELHKLTPEQQEKFIRYARIFLNNIDEL